MKWFSIRPSSNIGSTNIHYVLTNLGIRHVFVCGVFTDECIASAIRGTASGYTMWLITDACAAVTQQRHVGDTRVE